MLKGHFYPAEAASLSLTLTTPALKIEDNNWDGLVVSLSGNDSVLQASLGCELFRWNDQLSFDVITSYSIHYTKLYDASNVKLSKDS